MYQKMEMYEQAINIPLIINVPKADSAAFDVPVSHLDIMPTLLDLTEMESPDKLDGFSLRDTILAGAPPSDRPIFSQYSGNPPVAISVAL